MPISSHRSPALILGLGAAAAAGIWGRRDYRAWKALGPGGLPHTPRGWATTTRLRLRKADPIATGIYGDGDRAGVDALDRRNGPRPRVAPWPIPHRPLDQSAATGIRQELDRAFDTAVTEHSDLVHYALSHYETRTQAVTLRDPGNGHPLARLGEGEIAHIHPGDGSMHMIFSPSDAKRVIEAGWGERHPLAGVLLNLPDTYLLIYAPRDQTELEVVKQLLQASIGHMGARDL